MSEEARQNIKVVCRVRPTNKIEQSKVTRRQPETLSPALTHRREAPTA